MKVSHFIFRNMLERELIIIINTSVLRVVFHVKDYANTYFTCRTIVIYILSERLTRKRPKNPKQRPELCIPSLSKLHPCTNMEFPIWCFPGMLLGHTAFHTGEDHRVKTQTTNNQAEGLPLMRQSPPMKNKEERQEMMGKDTLK